jgi:ParB family chromosome partitioning protein
MGHARCLLVLDEDQQSHVARLIIAKQLSVRETEALVTRVKAGVVTHSKKEPLQPLFEDEINDLSKRLQTKIKIKPGKAGKGTLVIHYHNESNLQTMLSQLAR